LIQLFPVLLQIVHLEYSEVARLLQVGYSAESALQVAFQASQAALGEERS
jgi:hypothetical protein